MKINCIVQKLVLVSALALGGIVATTSAAEADPVPAGQELYVSDAGTSQNPNNNTVFTFGVSVSDASGNQAPAGTGLTLDSYSCGRLLSSTSKTLDETNGDGIVAYYDDSAIHNVSTSIEYNLTITQPGYDGYQRSGSYSGYNVKRPSCDQLNGGGASNGCTIKRDAAKVGKARVGRTVKVRAPKTIGTCGHVSYTWKANGKVVKRTKTLAIKPSLKGQQLVVAVTLAKTKPTVLRFGRVR